MDVDTGTRLATAAVFVWLGIVGVGLVLGISLLKASRKSGAPEVPHPIGGDIGRLVFRVLSASEYVFAIVIAFALFTHETSIGFNVAVLVAVGALLIQTIVVRPLLSRRPQAQLAFVALEVAKVIALIWTGALLVG